MPVDDGAITVEIGLNAAIVAVTSRSPRILAVSEGQEDSRDGLPFGPFDPARHRTFETSLRASVEQQTALDLGYIEQLYTFGDRGRHRSPGEAGKHMVSVGYLALTRTDAENNARLADAGAHWRDWYSYLPWEDWRQGRPAIIDQVILPALRLWEKTGHQDERMGLPQRRTRMRLAFGLDDFPWDEERVLERYELLYEAGLVGEAVIDGRTAATATPPIGLTMRHDHRRHRRCAATRQDQIPAGDLRADAAGIHTDGPAGDGRGHFRPPSAQAELPPPGRRGRTGGTDRHADGSHRRPAGGPLPLPPPDSRRTPRPGIESRRPIVRRPPSPIAERGGEKTLFDHRAGQPFAGIAGGLATVIVGFGVDHQRPAANAVFGIVEHDHAVEHLPAQNAVAADILVRHVAGMRAVGSKEPVFGLAGIEMVAGRAVAVRGIAFAGFMDMEPHPFARRQVGHLDFDEHAILGRCQGRPARFLAVLADEIGDCRLRRRLCKDGCRDTGGKRHRQDEVLHLDILPVDRARAINPNAWMSLRVPAGSRDGMPHGLFVTLKPPTDKRTQGAMMPPRKT
jgi:hypothetical protein